MGPRKLWSHLSINSSFLRCSACVLCKVQRETIAHVLMSIDWIAGNLRSLLQALRSEAICQDRRKMNGESRRQEFARTTRKTDEEDWEP
jgi:hypothetical protein